MERFNMSLSHLHELQPFVVSDVRATGRVLGEGSYGSVEEAEIPGATCVVKKLHEALLPAPTEAMGAERMASSFVEECRLMSSVRHPHIVQFLGICFLPESRLPALIMEKLLIDLHNLLENNSDIPLSIKHFILLGVSKGLTYLHTRTPAIIHRDLTAKNVLLNSAMVAKIADLGNSRLVNVRPSQLMTMTKNPGNMWYMPPEAQEDASKYNTSIDVFSFGNLTLFTLTQTFPKIKAATYTNSSTGRINARSEIERRSDSFEKVSLSLGRDHPLVRLTKHCLQNFPSRRPPITEVLAVLETVGESIEDRHSHLSKLEMMRLYEKELHCKEKELQSLKRDHDALKHEVESRQYVVKDYEARLRRMDEARQLELGRNGLRHKEEQEQLQQKLTSLEAQLRCLQAQGAVSPTPSVQSRPKLPEGKPKLPEGKPKRPEGKPALPPRPKLLELYTAQQLKPKYPVVKSPLQARPRRPSLQSPASPSKQQQQRCPASSLPSASTANIVIPRAVIGKERTITIQARSAKGEPYPHGGEDVQATLTPPLEPHWAPKIYLEKVKAAYSYTKTQNDELSFASGAVIYVTKKHDNGWLQGVIQGGSGLIPSNYVEKLEHVPVALNINAKVHDKKDGTYQISFTTKKRGYHQLDITMEKQPIKGSPFTIYSRESRSYLSLPEPLLTFSVRQPWGVAVSENGDLYAALSLNFVEVFNGSGSKVLTIGGDGSKHGQFDYPNSISLRGRVMFVADTWNNRIQTFTLSGNFISMFGTKGEGSGEFSFPHGVCLDHEGRVFVADGSNSRVSVFNDAYSFLYNIGNSSSDHKLGRPWGLAFDPSGNLHVADYKLECVKVFSPNGDFITEYGQGELEEPRYIAINEEGFSFVTDNALSIFDPQHRRIYRSEKMNARGVALDKDGHIYVANYDSQKIIKF